MIARCRIHGLIETDGFVEVLSADWDRPEGWVPCALRWAPAQGTASDMTARVVAAARLAMVCQDRLFAPVHMIAEVDDHVAVIAEPVDDAPLTRLGDAAIEWGAVAALIRELADGLSRVAAWRPLARRPMIDFRHRYISARTVRLGPEGRVRLSGIEGAFWRDVETLTALERGEAPPVAGPEERGDVYDLGWLALQLLRPGTRTAFVRRGTPQERPRDLDRVLRLDWFPGPSELVDIFRAMAAPDGQGQPHITEVAALLEPFRDDLGKAALAKQLLSVEASPTAWHLLGGQTLRLAPMAGTVATALLARPAPVPLARAAPSTNPAPSYVLRQVRVTRAMDARRAAPAVHPEGAGPFSRRLAASATHLHRVQWQENTRRWVAWLLLVCLGLAVAAVLPVVWR